MSYKDYIPAGSLEVNEDHSDFKDFVPEPKPEFKEPVAKEPVSKAKAKKKPVKKVKK